MSDSGTLWLEYPRVGGTSPELDIALTPETPSWFRRHSLRLQHGDLKWVEASGAKGLRSIRVRVSGGTEDEPHGEDERSFIVRLHFSEPDGKKAGQRQFDVTICDQTVLKNFDIAAETQSPNTGIVKEFRSVRASEYITVALTPADPDVATVLCGIEIIAEEVL